MRRPPVVLILLSVLLLALGTTAGVAMSVLAPQIRAYATERIFAAREVHYLSGSRDYNADVVADIVFTVEAGLSFLHTQAEGMGGPLCTVLHGLHDLRGRPGPVAAGVTGSNVCSRTAARFSEKFAYLAGPLAAGDLQGMEIQRRLSASSRDSTS